MKSWYFKIYQQRMPFDKDKMTAWSKDCIHVQFATAHRSHSCFIDENIYFPVKNFHWIFIMSESQFCLKCHALFQSESFTCLWWYLFLKKYFFYLSCWSQCLAEWLLAVLGLVSMEFFHNVRSGWMYSKSQNNKWNVLNLKRQLKAHEINCSTEITKQFRASQQDINEVHICNNNVHFCQPCFLYDTLFS
jgi:hypothetical protein